MTPATHAERRATVRRVARRIEEGRVAGDITEATMTRPPIVAPDAADYKAAGSMGSTTFATATSSERCNSLTVSAGSPYVDSQNPA